jgi:predicted nucleic acid-binding protein
MVRYADTCLLLSLIFRDAGTAPALAWLESAGADPIMVSHWTITEFASAAGIMARRGDLSPHLHREGLERFRRFVTLRLRIEAPAAADFERASIWIENYRSGLRAGDALHLAICARTATMLCTADHTLADAANGLGLAVMRIE